LLSRSETLKGEQNGADDDERDAPTSAEKISVGWLSRIISNKVVAREDYGFLDLLLLPAWPL